MPRDPEALAELVTLTIKASLGPVLAALAGAEATVAGLRERVTLLEARALVAGPAGRDGKDGLDGKAGADGLGFDDLTATFDGHRTITLAWSRGATVKTFPIVLPFQKYTGVYVEGKAYAAGDVVTAGGSQWHCNEDTAAAPREGTKAWTLAVKRGRDGKDGKDGAAGAPVVKGS